MIQDSFSPALVPNRKAQLSDLSYVSSHIISSSQDKEQAEPWELIRVEERKLGIVKEQYKNCLFPLIHTLSQKTI